MNQTFSPGPTYAISVTNSSVAVAFGATNLGEDILLDNTGSVICYIALGSSTVSASVPTTAWTMGAMPVIPGIPRRVKRGEPNQTHIATICAGSGSTTLNVTVGEGVP